MAEQPAPLVRIDQLVAQLDELVGELRTAIAEAKSTEGHGDEQHHTTTAEDGDRRDRWPS